MSHWSLLIYGLAAVWAVQALLTLMAHRRRRRLYDLQQAEIARRQTAPPVLPATEPTPANQPTPVPLKKAA